MVERKDGVRWILVDTVFTPQVQPQQIGRRRWVGFYGALGWVTEVEEVGGWMGRGVAGREG